jgi:hypothetical protein
MAICSYLHFKKISINLQKGFILTLLLSGCSGSEKSEEERLREQNAKGEYIYRNHNEHDYELKASRHRAREPFPWEESVADNSHTN